MAKPGLLKKALGKKKQRKKAFTLVEVLVAVGIVGVLAGVTIQAVAPRKSILAATDSKRVQTARHIENAMYQYLIGQWTLPNEAQIPEGEANARPICAQGIVDSTCANIDPLIAPDYIAYVPRDDMEPCALYTGYKTYKQSGRPRVIARFLGKLPGDAYAAEDCGNPVPPTLVPLAITDDVDSAYALAGCSLSQDPIGYLNDHRTCPTVAGPLQNNAYLSAQQGTYKIYATWVVVMPNQMSVTYTIKGWDNNGTLIDIGSATVNQGSAPNDAQYGGSMWEELATVTTVNGQGIRVYITSAAGSFVADGFMATAP